MKATPSTLLVTAAALLAAPGMVQAQAWPQAGKPVQLIVPAPGGGGTGDAIARLIAQGLGQRLGTTVVVDNKGGANGNIGAAAAAAAAPDGYRLLFSWAGTLAVLAGAAIVLGLLTRWAALVLAVESLVAIIAGWQVTNVEFRLAALAAFVALALLGPQQYALDMKWSRLASWSWLGDIHGPASKTA